MLGRTPTLTELGVFSALWSEHCSYKHSKPVLKRFPTDRAAGGPGTRRERRRAPPARRLGGRLQDRVAQSSVGGRALPGRRDRRRRHPARRLHHGRAPGRGAQQPSVRPARRRRGTATSSPAWCAASATTATASASRRSAARWRFAPGYTGNPLVNAMCVGTAPRGRPDPGARPTASATCSSAWASRTGRDGIHGASFASEELSEKSEARRPQVQVGDPFTEKLLLEASLELITGGSSWPSRTWARPASPAPRAEMAARGGVGVELDTARVPTREPGMTPYEILLSESQERMLVVAEPAPGGGDPGGLRQVGARRRRRSAASPTTASSGSRTTA